MSRSAPDTYLGTKATVTAPLPNALEWVVFTHTVCCCCQKHPPAYRHPFWQNGNLPLTFFLRGVGGGGGEEGAIVRQREMGNTGSRHWSRVWIVFVPCLFCDVIRFVLLWCRFWGPERLWRIHKQGELTALDRRHTNNKGHKWEPTDTWIYLFQITT